MKLWCFDIDGTLIRSFIRESGQAEDYDRVELLPGRVDHIAQLPADARFALVTNQGGVAFGYQTVTQVLEKIGRVQAALRFFDGRPASVHVAMLHPSATIPGWKAPPGDEQRKPGPGMIFDAMRVHGVGKQDTMMIGDMDSDAQAATAANVPYWDAREFFGQ